MDPKYLDKQFSIIFIVIDNKDNSICGTYPTFENALQKAKWHEEDYTPATIYKSWLDTPFLQKLGTVERGQWYPEKVVIEIED